MARWLIFYASAIAGLVLALEAGHLFVTGLNRLHAARVIPLSADPSQHVAAPASSQGPRVAAWLPGSEDFDVLSRFANRLAREQQLNVTQLQTEAVRTAPGHLSQRRITLQLRGDYVPSKTLLIALLAKFPGLTLEKLSIRHQPATSNPGNAVARAADDQTTIELIQYSGPTPAAS